MHDVGGVYNNNIYLYFQDGLLPRLFVDIDSVRLRFLLCYVMIYRYVKL